MHLGRWSRRPRHRDTVRGVGIPEGVHPLRRHSRATVFEITTGGYNQSKINPAWPTSCKVSGAPELSTLLCLSLTPSPLNRPLPPRQVLRKGHKVTKCKWRTWIVAHRPSDPHTTWWIKPRVLTHVQACRSHVRDEERRRCKLAAAAGASSGSVAAPTPPATQVSSSASASSLRSDDDSESHEPAPQISPARANLLAEFEQADDQVNLFLHECVDSGSLTDRDLPDGWPRIVEMLSEQLLERAEQLMVTKLSSTSAYTSSGGGRAAEHLRGLQESPVRAGAPFSKGDSLTAVAAQSAGRATTPYGRTTHNRTQNVTLEQSLDDHQE